MAKPTLGEFTDGELSRRCRNGDARAWQHLVQQFTPKVYRLAVRMLNLRSEAEDTCQEVFMRVHRSFDSHDATRPLFPWIARITYHVCLARLTLQSGKNQEFIDGEEQDFLVNRPELSPERQLANQEVMALLEGSLLMLPAQDRALMILRYREGLSDAEIAEATGMPVNTVKTRIYRARGVLMSQLEPVWRG